MKRRRLKEKIGLTIVAFALILAVCAYFVEKNVRPLINSAACERVSAVVSRIINDAVAQTMNESGTSYSDLINIVYDEDKNVKSIESNTVLINSLKAKINQRVINDVAAQKSGELQISLGSFIGGDLLIGRGPKIKLKFDLTNTANSTFHDTFTAAGINQTKHTIMLNVTNKVNILIPWCNSSTTFKTDVMIAETVIVGTVPDVYTNISADNYNNYSENK